VPSKLAELTEKRARLVAQCATQRAALGAQYQQFQRPARLAQSTLGLWNTIRRSPLFLTAAAALLVRTPWRKMARFPKLAWRGWKIFQFARSWMK